MRLNAQYYQCLARQIQSGGSCPGAPTCSTSCASAGGGAGGLLNGFGPAAAGNPKTQALNQLANLGLQWLQSQNRDTNTGAAPEPDLAEQQAAQAAARQAQLNAAAAALLAQSNALAANLNGSPSAPNPTPSATASLSALLDSGPSNDSTSTISALLGGTDTPADNGNTSAAVAALLGQAASASDGGVADDLEQTVHNAQQMVFMEGSGWIPAPKAEIDFPQTAADAAQMYTPAVQDSNVGWASNTEATNPALAAWYKDAPPIQVVTYPGDGTMTVQSYPQTFQAEITFPSPSGSASPTAAPAISAPLGAPAAGSPPDPTAPQPTPVPTAPQSMPVPAPAAAPPPIGNANYATSASHSTQEDSLSDSSVPATDCANLLNCPRQWAAQKKQQVSNAVHDTWNKAMEAKNVVLTGFVCTFDNSCEEPHQ